MRIAALDVGSNSLHLLVVDAHADRTFEPIVQEKEVLRLGDVVSRHGRLDEASVERVVDTIRRLKALATSTGAGELIARATAAFREAENSAEVIDRLDAETGVRIEVVSGREEARLIFAAVRASVIMNRPPALCLDLGGGSLEVAVGDAAGPQWLTSLHLGVARLTSELVRSDPPSAKDRARLEQRVREALEPIRPQVSALEPGMLIGTSGTLCDLARMAAARSGTPPSSVNHLTVCRDDLVAVHEALFGRPLASRRRMAGLDARRADQICAGSTVLQVAMELFDQPELTVSDWALREGLVLDVIDRLDPLDWTEDQEAIRRASVLGLCRRCGWNEEHATGVVRLALELFDQTRSLHGLGAGDRELLEYGSLLHDIGEHVSADGHHKHTAYLIEHGRLRGFAPDELAVLASLGRFHRRGEPKPSFAPYGSLDARRRADVDVLVSLLRLADGLDCGHSGQVEGVSVEVRDDEVLLRVHAEGDAGLELWGARRKRELFERVTGRRLALCVEAQLGGARGR